VTTSIDDFVESWRTDKDTICSNNPPSECSLNNAPTEITNFCNKIYGPSFTGMNIRIFHFKRSEQISVLRVLMTM
jgi:hypothetical protein